MTALSSRPLSLAPETSARSAVSRRSSALYCATYGRGTPLLLIHGFGASGSMFQPLIPALVPGRCLIVPDLRGHGNSRRLPLADSVARLAADLDDLLDLLGVGLAFVLGYAGGAAVAQQLAHDYPARVRGLVLACAAARGSGARARGAGRLRGISGLLRDRGERAGECSADAGHSLLETFDSRPWLGQLDMPALVVAGGADTIAPLAQARDLAGRLPHARLEVIPGAGHWLIETHTDALAEITRSWMRHQEAA